MAVTQGQIFIYLIIYLLLIICLLLVSLLLTYKLCEAGDYAQSQAGTE